MFRRSTVTRVPTARRLVAALFITGATTAAVGSFAVPAGARTGAVTHAQINGSGSSWAANALNQWVSDVTSKGLSVVYTASGSAQGRTDFRNGVNDFAVSDIGFQGVDQVTGASDTNCAQANNPSTCRAYAYEPVVAGGTSFPYQLKVAGQLVRNLRLSGETIAKIFTNKITNWDDPAIAKDNNGRKFPSLPIIPVVHSEGSGSTAQFTRYLDTEYPSIWRPFAGRAGLTEYFPRKDPQVAENGSDGVINFITSGAANGSIGYDEYSYALGKNYPVVNLENKAGYFVPPTQYNVAVALTKAEINYDKSSKDYLLQNLDHVYTMPDRRAYPLSSYSYVIVPLSTKDPRMTTAKRQTLADFLYYDICQGQAEMGPIGYSPLPINLVEASFQQTNKLHDADKGVHVNNENVTTCHNPTFVAGNPKQNYLAKIAPQPPACDKVGAGPCAAGADVVNGNPNGGKPPKAPSGGSNGSANGGSGGSPGTGTPTAGGSGGTSSVPGSGQATGTGGTSGATTVNPITGQQEPVVANSGGAGGAVIGQPSTLPVSDNGGVGGLLAVLAALELLLLLAIPPLLANRFRRGGNGQ